MFKKSVIIFSILIVTGFISQENMAAISHTESSQKTNGINNHKMVSAPIYYQGLQSAREAKEEKELKEDIERLNSEIERKIPKLVEIVKIVDGDTIIATFKNESMEIDLCGINSPEIKEKFGKKSALKLFNLTGVLGTIVHLTPVEWDSIDKITGVIVNDGVNINLEMLKTGAAKIWEKGLSICWDNKLIDKAKEFESFAKKNKKGIWSK